MEIVEIGMVGSGFIKTGAVLSWEGIQYCGTSGFRVSAPENLQAAAADRKTAGMHMCEHARAHTHTRARPHARAPARPHARAPTHTLRAGADPQD